MLQTVPFVPFFTCHLRSRLPSEEPPMACASQSSESFTWQFLPSQGGGQAWRGVARAREGGRERHLHVPNESTPTLLRETS